MKKKIIFLLTFSHGIALVIGVGLGIYLLPILTAPKSSSLEDIQKIENNALYQTEFVKNLKGSDFLHHGEAIVTVTKNKITVNGTITPGPGVIANKNIAAKNAKIEINVICILWIILYKYIITFLIY